MCHRRSGPHKPPGSTSARATSTSTVPAVDYMLVPEKLEQCAVVMRHANFVFAGVRAHPDKWSEQYRALIARIAMALARRPVEDLKPIIVERQIHPPGAVRFDLDPIAEQGTSHRAFYFRFERPTAFTATLEHAGSDAMMLMFSGGKKHLHATRVDTEDGETMTITVNIGERAIRDLGHRYWSLGVQNFDSENPCSAKLTVRYDVADREETVRALPGNASFEYINGLAWNLLGAAQTDASARRQVATRSGSKEAIDLNGARLATAREHGFESWRHLEAHLAWKPVFDMRGGTVGVDSFYARVKARYGATFTVEQLIEFADDFTDDLHDTVAGASTGHRAGDQESFSGEHLLLALLDNPISAHAVKCVGVEVDGLRSELNELLDTHSDSRAGRPGVGFEDGLRCGLPGELHQRAWPRGNQRRESAGGIAGRELRGDEHTQWSWCTAARHRELRDARDSESGGSSNRDRAPRYWTEV